jgi:hypothetical protein
VLQLQIGRAAGHRIIIFQYLIKQDASHHLAMFVCVLRRLSHQNDVCGYHFDGEPEASQQAEKIKRPRNRTFPFVSDRPKAVNSNHWQGTFLALTPLKNSTTAIGFNSRSNS